MPGSTRNRRSRPLVRAALVFVLGGPVLARGLPCFLADNHAETFGWITRTVDLDQPHTLVLVDAHSDASATERSDEIREMLRRVVSEEERARRVETWRASGRIQAFNWIEPLMPRPIAKVVWWSDVDASAEAIQQLDGRLEVEPRDAGTFASRWANSAQPPAIAGPVLLTVDLDRFAGMQADERRERFARIWEQAMEWPYLSGVSFSVSRPWLTDDAEADELVRMAVDAVALTRGAMLAIAGGVDGSPDESLRAADWRKQGKPVPRWSLENASPALRTMLGGMGGRLRVNGADLSFPEPPELRAADGEPDCDGVWRFRQDELPVLRVVPPDGATGRVRWFALDPLHPAVDLWPHTGLGKGFSKRPARHISETPRLLARTDDFALAPDAWGGAHHGRFRIRAEVETAGGWIPTRVIELGISDMSGFRGALGESFGMPYVFGIASVAEGELSGVDTGWGSDCSNFLIHAWRRQGIPLAWGDPGRLRRQLREVATELRSDDGFPLASGWIENGVAIDFGSHVAALWEDLPPVGKLGGNDLVAHHLGGLPEITSLSGLASGRPAFALRIPKPAATTEIRVAGDVVLAGDAPRVRKGFGKGTARWFLANLEGVPSMARPDRAPRYDFRFPEDRLDRLVSAGVDAVSLANNHADDAGAVGLLEGIRALRDAKLGVFGAGANVREACRPWRAERDGSRIAVFGVCTVESMTAGEDSPGVVRLPEHAELLAAEMTAARGRGETIIILIHGGDEYDARVTDDQRRWARWLAARGARLIAGASPHVTQRIETHAGTVIAHSLGNAIYPAALSGADSGEVRSFRLPEASMP